MISLSAALHVLLHQETSALRARRAALVLELGEVDALLSKCAPLLEVLGPPPSLEAPENASEETIAEPPVDLAEPIVMSFQQGEDSLWRVVPPAKEKWSRVPGERKFLPNYGSKRRRVLIWISENTQVTADQVWAKFPVDRNVLRRLYDRGLLERMPISGSKRPHQFYYRVPQDVRDQIEIERQADR